MEGLRIPVSLAQEIIEHARAETPDECCGIMAGKDGVVQRIWRTVNIDHSPVKYTIDPRQMTDAFQEADKAGLEVLGFYHSHTQTEAYPSPTDVRLAPPSDLFGYLYVIVSLQEPERPVLRCFSIAERKVQETGLDVAG